MNIMKNIHIGGNDDDDSFYLQLSSFVLFGTSLSAPLQVPPVASAQSAVNSIYQYIEIPFVFGYFSASRFDIFYIQHYPQSDAKDHPIHDLTASSPRKTRRQVL